MTSAYERFVRDGGNEFRRSSVDAHHGLARVRWEMVPVGSGEPAGFGTDVLLLGDDGRIQPADDLGANRSNSPSGRDSFRIPG